VTLCAGRRNIAELAKVRTERGMIAETGQFRCAELTGCGRFDVTPKMRAFSVG
jgi:hypothetical protein